MILNNFRKFISKERHIRILISNANRVFYHIFILFLRKSLLHVRLFSRKLRKVLFMYISKIQMMKNVCKKKTSQF